MANSNRAIVTLGPRGENDQYEVLSGLKEGERVVTSGQFMLDSESQLREAIQKMLNPNAARSPPPQHAELAAATVSSVFADATRSTDAEQLRVPDAGARHDQIRSSRQMSDLQHDT